jgi:Cu/Ag efflux pump CusA
MTTQAKNASQYTAAMEAAIRAEPVLNAAIAARLAGEFGPKFTARGVIAKISRMEGVSYQRKAKVTKSGGAIEQKEAIVAEIAALVGANLEGLDKAPKPVLQTIRDFLAA